MYNHEHNIKQLTKNTIHKGNYQRKLPQPSHQTLLYWCVKSTDKLPKV